MTNNINSALSHQQPQHVDQPHQQSEQKIKMTLSPEKEKRFKELAEKIKKDVAEFAGEGMEVTMETHFDHDLEMDSLKVMELVMKVQDNHDVSIPDEKTEDVKTVGQLVSTVHELKWPETGGASNVLPTK
eukprot:CAMPEP_0113855440 /NCGR_PEP_ID=MMETSP0372-20130328/8249_1 /TAXON_ID=340204 /ORGANISM="Lankesteria abbotti" /LENGTH=129 /DNA_ID=CAMNT_0000829465 /DNA_START=402 /DNA_END=791 /DNA_ORIENTATION=- /assembly_acc=CAM_ASM_000359